MTIMKIDQQINKIENLASNVKITRRDAGNGNTYFEALSIMRVITQVPTSYIQDHHPEKVNQLCKQIEGVFNAMLDLHQAQRFGKIEPGLIPEKPTKHNGGSDNV